MTHPRIELPYKDILGAYISSSCDFQRSGIADMQPWCPVQMGHVNFHKGDTGEGVDWSHDLHQIQPNTAVPMPTAANPILSTHS